MKWADEVGAQTRPFFVIGRCAAVLLFT